jgi:CheY-like chemotaxis protein
MTNTQTSFEIDNRLSFFSLRNKLILLFLIVSLVPLISMGLLSYTQAQQALKTEVVNKLLAVRDIKAKQIVKYFNERLGDIKVLSQSPSTIAALQAFEEVVHSESGNDESNAMVHSRSLYLDKPNLVNAHDGSTYSAVHAQYHPIFQNYQETYGYYDLFLVELHTGTIIYSVMKEKDFGTSLLNGPYSDTNIGQVFQKTLAATHRDFTTLEDFAYYEPSKEAALFIASPIFDDAKLIGTLIFQLSTTQIDAIMQEHTGLGETGETLLVSSEDFLLRSNSRFSTESTLFKQKIDNEATHAAANGETGVTEIIDILGQIILFAYTPLNIPDVNWSLNAQIDKAEAFANARKMLHSILTVMAIGIGIVVIIAIFFSNSLTKPIRGMTDIAGKLAEGHLNLTVKVKSHDEIGLMGIALQKMITNLRQVIEDVVRLSQELAAGNLNVTPKSEYRGDFIQIKNALEIALPNQRQVIQDIIQVSQGLAKGNLQVLPQVQYQGDFVLVKEALENALSDLRQVIEDIVQVSQGLATGQQMTAQAEYQGDFAQIKEALEQTSVNLSQAMTKTRTQDWLKTGQTQLNEQMSGEQELAQLAKNIITFLAKYLEMPVGLFYLCEEKGPVTGNQELQINQDPNACDKARLKLIASYAYTHRQGIRNEFNMGEGLVGQAALEKKPIEMTKVPENYYLQIRSGLGKALPKMVIVQPFLYENMIKGVIELASFKTLTNIQLAFLHQIMPSIGIAINTAQSRTKMQNLLQTSQRQTEELQTQSEELQNQQAKLELVNKELEDQRAALQNKHLELQQRNEELQSQSEELQTQQEELRQANDELEERTKALQQQKTEVQDKNLALEKAQVAIETKAKELELASQYKSEFLANMSHELRTPLNSLLILANLLGENKDNNLNAKQVEYARTIHNAGSELLNLINEILDLSKVEAGKMEVHLEELPITYLVDTLKRKFSHIAEEKKLDFPITMANDLPAVLHTDGQRLEQIINNLLSNAFKFTHQGHVQLDIKLSPFLSEESLLPLGESHIPRENWSVHPLSLEENMKKAQIFPVCPLEEGRKEDKTFHHRPLGESQTFHPRPLGEAQTFHPRPLGEGRGEGRREGHTIAFSVTDTGIGIPEAKQQAIFEAFQQVDGTTSRRFGGTGLGLSISRQLARLLGGELRLYSEEGKGSTFTLYLPEKLPESDKTSIFQPETLLTTELKDKEESGPDLKDQEKTEKSASDFEAQTLSSEIVDDRKELKAGDQSILILEDDRKFSNILMELARERQFKCLIAEDGQTGLQLVETYQPNAIILDIGLPQIDGWTVMERLKDNPKTRHIPVHFISAAEQSSDAKKMGAIGYLQKPINTTQLGEAFKKIEQFLSQHVKKLLLVVDIESRQQKITELVGHENIKMTNAITKEAAFKSLAETTFDCMILDMDIEQQSGIQFVEQLVQKPELTETPLIVYAERELTAVEEGLLLQYEDSITVKSVRSPERLLDEAMLFLHQIEAQLPPEKRNMLQMVHDKATILKHKKVLIVDDDNRNTFALATVLEDHDMEVVCAKNGKRGLTKLEQNNDVDIVLMDIMMPEMDGYEAMQAIRQQSHLQKLPIIALTAKAMKGDKAKCIEAGANDYLAKPVDTDKLISLMRVWLYK